MKSPAVKYKLLLAGGALVAALGLSGCADKKQYSDLRVIHASKDAPPVNVLINKRKRVRDLDYAESSGYIEVRSGTRDIAVEAITPAGKARVIEVKGFDFEADERYNVLAVGDTADIAALVAPESTTEPANDEVSIAIVHASTNAGGVDIYLTAPGDLLNGLAPISIDYQGVIDASAIPVGTYQIRVALGGEADPDNNLVYDSGPIDLAGFAGDKLMVAAISSVTDTELAASPIKLLVANDIAQVELLDINTLVGARVVHLSADAGTAAGGPVEVFATSDALPGTVELIDAFAYTDIVPAGGASYVGVPGGDYVFDVAPNTDSIGDSVYTSPVLALASGVEYSVIAAGNVLTAPAFGLLATADENRAVMFQASVKVVHAAPAAGLVDVYVTPASVFSAADVIAGAAGKPLLKDFAFGDITDYVAVTPGKYDIRVIAGGAAAINVENFELPEGLVGTIIARQPDGDGSPADFGAVVLTN